jgi:hypothetical protein
VKINSDVSRIFDTTFTYPKTSLAQGIQDFLQFFETEITTKLRNSISETFVSTGSIPFNDKEDFKVFYFRKSDSPVLKYASSDIFEVVIEDSQEKSTCLQDIVESDDVYDDDDEDYIPDEDDEDFVNIDGVEEEDVYLLDGSDEISDEKSDDESEDEDFDI